MDLKQIKLDQGNSRIRLPKLGWLRYRNSRAVLGEVRQATVSERAGKWFISILTQREVPQLPAKPVQAAATYHRITAAHKHASRVWNADSKKTPMWSARSMC